MTRRTRLPDTAYPLGRILQFPVRHDVAGQYELFFEPAKPDPHSASQLVIQYTLAHMRLTRISTFLSPQRRAFYFGELAMLLNSLERDELHIATQQKLAAEIQQARIA